MSLTKSMIFISLISMCWWRKTIIMLLMSLELMMISLFMSMLMNNQSSQIPILMMLTMMVSGSTIGLSLLVAMANSHNSSNSIFINMLTFDKTIYSLHYISMFHKKY